MTNKSSIDTTVALSDKEMELLRMYAMNEGITEEEAASRLASDAMARRVRKHTGKSPAKVYSINRH